MYKNIGDNVIIQADFPRVFDVISFVLRLNGSTGDVPANCMDYFSTLTYNCSHLTTDNNGVYLIHIEVDTTLNNDNKHPEWCSNNVTIIVQSKAQSNIYIYIYIYIVTFIDYTQYFFHPL